MHLSPLQIAAKMAPSVVSLNGGDGMFSELALTSNCYSHSVIICEYSRTSIVWTPLAKSNQRLIEIGEKFG